MKHPIFQKSLITATICLLIASIAGTAPTTLTVEGSAASKPGQWTVSQLHDQFAAKLKIISYEGHGEKHTCTCVPLLAVLEAAGVPTTIKMDPTADPKTKHRALRIAVLAAADDGYAVVFSMAELLPDIGNREAWIAIDQDGKPLPDRDAPVKLIIPGDAKPARNIHGIEHLIVIELTTPATLPAK